MVEEDVLALGRPRFQDVALARLAAEKGVIAAWRQSLTLRGAKAAVAGVDGDFAIALRERSGRTFLAVDRFGIQTLCYCIRDGVVHFAERADAFVGDESPLVPQAFYDYLYFHTIPSPRTIHEGVFRLPPAHFAVYEGGSLIVEPYWVPEFKPAVRPVFADLRDEFLHLLRQAVRRQLDGTEPACFLSGGTDSSTVAGVIAEISGRAPASYSIGFEAQGYDEMKYARVASRRFGTRHHEYYVTPDDLMRAIPLVAAYFDQPFGNSSVLPAYYCGLKAEADGVTRLLAGDGGDELFGGNSRYARQKLFSVYSAIPARSRLAVLAPLFTASPINKLALVRKGMSYVEQARVGMPDRLQIYNLLLRLGPEHVLTKSFLTQVNTEAPAKQQNEVWAQARASSEVDRTLAYDWRYTLAETDLPKVRSATRMAHVEVAFPLLDEDLLRFSMRLPAHYKVRGMKLRWFFKEALRGFLPEEIISKKKQGFGLPFGVWTMRHTALREFAFESLNSLSLRNIVRPEFIVELRDQRLAEHPGYYGEMVWILMMLEQWLQRHAQGFAISG